MDNISVTKEFTWDMAHMLAHHEGMCQNLHGHTYKMQVEIVRFTGNLIKGSDPSKGMVLDFKDLKDIVNERIVKELDHAFMYWVNSPDKTEHEIARILIESGKKVVKVDYRPTAEEMALNFLRILRDEFKKFDVDVKSVKVWETPTSYAKAW
ncbi:precorrin-3B C17-methyltransferase [Fervidicella metallireducens AeB]|uniref:6-carboxy-5,6,7,8-tetrahydropterin synthase n=1 Tax=Fervidicella metallireducens AeB TaxID=1403537 RepID=A0A017RVB2_9CLOT|nr:6-carboxytetrahydropterin synthase [Fervidicella metallireducens]EYE87850.1 precorrin-3B C17-methyltransferase [Fervidicella metallireducens AeB]